MPRRRTPLAPFALAMQPTEKDVERQLDRLMQTLGWKVIRLSQPRRSMVSIGLPDRRYLSSVHRHSFWCEVKRPGGKQSDKQKEFQAMVESAGDDYVLGGVQEVMAYLSAKGFIPRGNRAA